MADSYAAEKKTPAAQPDESPAKLAQQWINELEEAEKDADRQAWLTRCNVISNLYAEKRSNSSDSKKRFALFWSNIEVLKPAVLARVPTAVVTRRFRDQDPVGRLSSEVLERALNFAMDAYDFDAVLKASRDDYLLFARALPWVRYIPTLRTEDGQGKSDEVTDDAEPYEVVDWEEVRADHVHYKDFFHSPAREWDEVRWVARRAYLTREELVARFPECGKDVPLDYAPPDKPNLPDSLKKAAIYEIWDRVTKRAIWISKGYTEKPLDVKDDPLKLKDFFPCPKPALGTVSPDSLIPTPDYIYYQDQCEEIDKLTARIDYLLDALKVRGFYAASKDTDLNTLLSSNDNTLIPIESWAMLKDGGGLKGLIEWFPLDQVVTTLKQCFEARRELISDVYQVTGISDIQRGDTDPDETLGAQKLKAGFGSARAHERKKELARLARDVLQIKGEIIATTFDQKTLADMTGVKLLTDAEKQQLQQQIQASQVLAQRQAQMAPQGAPPPPPPPPPVTPQQQEMLALPSWDEVMGLLRNPALRMFRIDIETDSTIEPNDQEEKQRRIEFIQAIGKYLADSLPVVEAQPPLLPVIAQGLMWLVRGFRVGREMEDVLERAMDQLNQAAQQPQQQQKQGPDPQAEQMKAQASLEQAKAASAKVGVEQQRVAIEGFQAQSAHQIGMADVQAENNRTAADLHAQMHEAVIKSQERRLVHEINSERPIEAPTR